MTDLLDLLAEMELADTPWTGAPLAYTTDYWSPEDLLAAFDRYVAEHGHFACIPRSHMWHRGFALSFQLERGDHSFVQLVADTRCDADDHDHSAAPLPGDLMYQVICEPCRWHLIANREGVGIEAWHDHALPGWRDLPILPANLKWDDIKEHRAAVSAWVTDHYPSDWQRSGVPLLTWRQPNATRPVSGRSPFGGFDLGVTA